ncbi:DUF2239 family protein [Roseimicrobium sp. ORNL1]|uniref:DUF2239 family protein n=1 Tax=Roseimicrobium sp. ORNL1 TaxID=2711231 RepID=UPI0013E1471E|nr:DUF2239 family protein [Roseimicrobium sp. ORNL1]QIF02711.1 DUF2239 family protein [Roseimicrobium sp. ORNL1]
MILPPDVRQTYTCFHGSKRLVTGSLTEVALETKRAHEGDASAPVLIFDNRTGRTVEVDMRGSEAEVINRLKPIQDTHEAPETSAILPADAETPADVTKGRGRPKLGVTAREVTLLPRHWEWLATQPGGASVALRKLVEEARRTHAEKDRLRQSRERTYHFISVLAGDLPGFEESSRALFAGNVPKFAECMAAWPADMRDHALWLTGDVAG